jgi:hypothetical protein
MMTQMLMGGGGGLVIPMPGGSTSDTVFDPADALATVTINRDGTLTGTGGDFGFSHNWYRNGGATIGDGFWVRATVTSGGLSGGSGTGTWLQLSSSRNWQRNRTTVGSSAGTITLEIATDSGGTNIVTSGSYTLTATVEI